MRPVGLFERPLIHKLFRYSMVSVVGVTCGQTTLTICTAVLGWPGVPANLVAVTAGAIPSYLLNRYWVWEKSGPNSFRTEILPFWIMSLLGLLLSTIAVAYAEDRWGSPSLAINIANLAGFGVLWIAKFLILDRVLFAPER